MAFDTLADLKTAIASWLGRPADTQITDNAGDRSKGAVWSGLGGPVSLLGCAGISPARKRVHRTRWTWR